MPAVSFDTVVAPSAKARTAGQPRLSPARLFGALRTRADAPVRAKRQAPEIRNPEFVGAPLPGQGLAGRSMVLTLAPCRRPQSGQRPVPPRAYETPLVSCASLGLSLDFYERVLGFRCVARSEGAAAVACGGGLLRLREVGYGVNLKDERRQQICRFEVEDLGAVWADIEPRLRYLSGDRVRPPFEDADGQRVFHVADPDALLVTFAALAP